jgi:hypothetical protein
MLGTISESHTSKNQSNKASLAKKVHNQTPIDHQKEQQIYLKIL